MLAVGDKVPRFSLESDVDGIVRSESFGAAPVVLYFYPRDATPGCTREAQAFSSALGAFHKLGVRVYGISKDSLASHARFREKLGLTVPLLSDPDLTVHRAFGAFGEKVMYGKKVMGVLRSTFVVAGSRVVAAFPKVRVDGHEAEVLAAVRALVTPGAGPRAADTAAKAATSPRAASAKAKPATKARATSASKPRATSAPKPKPKTKAKPAAKRT